MFFSNQDRQRGSDDGRARRPDPDA